MPFAGIDFPDLFARDNFTSRRTTGHNLYDPESLLTGFEASQGFTYVNSHREFPGHTYYLDAVQGRVRVADIPTLAPRVLRGMEGCIAPICLAPPSTTRHGIPETADNSPALDREIFRVVVNG